MPDTTVTIRPAAGLVVRDPATRAPLATEGELKTLDTYWSRRLLDGDVHLVADAAATTQPAAKAALKAPQGSAQ
ncbi:DUF2635 domain-containing protein [Pseudaquabacterium pictum]|uniref:DUF2635 domain-containing protein n=1 Tax=Pseudaquabacterium pictum TaxID=2315236 RepID=A0A480AW35_9BURK|nr:DUF2635 domain-containing protein [Rubrivivax pictus]GCL64317.1 hypothetical protein AQPW35_33980 [Rubrivivax pictus]